jgi:hypothetical protein
MEVEVGDPSVVESGTAICLSVKMPYNTFGFGWLFLTFQK